MLRTTYCLLLTILSQDGHVFGWGSGVFGGLDDGGAFFRRGEANNQSQAPENRGAEGPSLKIVGGTAPAPGGRATSVATAMDSASVLHAGAAIGSAARASGAAP